MKRARFSSDFYVYLGGAGSVLLIIGIFFIYVNRSLESARESALIQAKESLWKTYLLLYEVSRRNPLPQNVLIKNSESDIYSNFTHEMSKSTPGWNMEKTSVPSTLNVAYRVLRAGEVGKSSELQEMVSLHGEEARAFYELENEKGIVKLIAPLGEENYIVITGNYMELFSHLRRLERHGDLLIASTLFMSIMIIYIAYLLFRIQKKEQVLEKSYETRKNRIEEIAMVDTLTGAISRRKFDEALEEFIYMANNFDYRFSLILFDIDNFKSINDTYGHDAGDTVLVQISSFVKKNIRKSDLFARWGGEEFIILTPMLDLSEALSLAEKIRDGIAGILFENVGQVTCSFGVSEYFETDTAECLFKEADQRLYEAKNSGKNKVVPSE